MKLGVPNIKGCTCDYSEYSILESLDYLSVAICGAAPELETIIPDGFEQHYIDKPIVGEAKLRSVAKDPVKFSQTEV